MPITLTVRDETLTGATERENSLDFLTDDARIKEPTIVSQIRAGDPAGPP